MIKISLPNPQEYGDNIKGFLRQLELSVHHAQKAYEQMVVDEMITDNAYITYRHPKVELYDREHDNTGCVKVHVDEEQNEFLNIELEIQE